MLCAARIGNYAKPPKYGGHRLVKYEGRRNSEKNKRNIKYTYIIIISECEYQLGFEYFYSFIRQRLKPNKYLHNKHSKGAI